MKIVSFEKNGGDIRATVIAEKGDIARSSDARRAIEDCVRRLAAQQGIETLALARITRMEDGPDGGGFL